MKKVLIIIGVLLFTINNSFAQPADNQPWVDTNRVDNYNHFYASLNGGLHQFYGDVSSDVFFPGTMMKGKVPWSISPRVGWDFNPRFGLRTDFNVGQIWAQSNKPGQDIYFHASMMDIQGDFLINLTNVVFPYIYNKRWNMTVFVGAGWMFYRSIARNSADQILAVEGYDNNANKLKRISERLWTAGFSGGYKITKHLDISAEVKFYNTPTDKIDGVNKVLSEYDNYSTVSLGITYYFGKHEQEWKWNPIDPFFEEITDSIDDNNQQLVDLGNKVDNLQKCCEAKDPANLPDLDEDGVPDEIDLEPNTPKGTLVNFQGKTIPQGPAEGQGNGGPNGTGVGGSPMFFNSVYFPFDKSTIDQENYREIIKVAQYMRAHPGTKIMISGNTDERGSNAYNDALSDRRVKAVKAILLKDFGFADSDFSEEKLGETKLFSKTTHWVNRRVDFFIVK